MPPTALTPETAHPIPSDQMLAEPRNWSGRFGKEITLLSPPPSRQKLYIILKTQT
jgi:hypothetical protein